MTVRLVISDEVNIKLENLPLDARKKLAATFKYEIPYAKYQPAFKLGRWDGMVSLFGIGGNGYLSQLEKILAILDNMGITIDDVDDKRIPITLAFDKVTESYWADRGNVWPVGHPAAGEPIMLRDYQVAAINTFFENPQSLQSLPTGSGKTITIATMVKQCEKFGRTITIVPNKSLVEQTEEDFVNCQLDVGVYYGDRKDLYKTHTICTWQSLNIFDKKSKNSETDILTLAEFLEDVKTVIIDECHVAKAEVLRSLLTQNLKNAPVRWGLTGTIPKEAYEYESIFASLGPVVGKLEASDLQDMGVLSSCHVSVIQLIDVLAFKSYPDELAYLVTNADRMKYISKLISTISESGNTLVLVNRIDSGNAIVDAIPGSVFISGKIKTKDRKSEYDQVSTSTDKIIVATYGVAAVGLNIVRINNLILLEPGKSFTRVIQSIGRGLRKGFDKESVEIYDITSTCKFSKRHLTARKKYYDEVKYPYTIKKVDWK
jgi:superfamily II DNA or RNA helicase